MDHALEADYVIVGAGAAGMAFADALLTHSDATIAIVDRRHAPGGHWLDAYPFVRLHQPSSFYGVDSVPLGSDSIDAQGSNMGFYELAGCDEIRAYYERVMHRHFLPTGRVQYFPGCDYIDGNRFVSRLTGASSTVRVRKKVVDTTYLEGEIPATSPPPFAVADGVRCVAPGELPRLGGSFERFVIIGGGKTALDVGVWLLERGVPASAIRWVRPREAWWMNRRFQQPHTMLPDMLRGKAIQVEAMAHAQSIDALLERLESEGIFLRIDRAASPTMLRGAIASETEIELLRGIEDVVRKGHVRGIERDRIILEGGAVPTGERAVHIHCAARALVRPPLRPIYEPSRVTVQPISWGFACHQFATLGVVEATIESDDEKNRLCPPIHYWHRNEDYVAAFLAGMAFSRAASRHPVLANWSKTSRLSPTGRIADYEHDPRVGASRESIKRNAGAAVMNMTKLLAER